MDHVKLGGWYFELSVLKPFREEFFIKTNNVIIIRNCTLWRSDPEAKNPPRSHITNLNNRITKQKEIFSCIFTFSGVIL